MISQRLKGVRALSCATINTALPRHSLRSAKVMAKQTALRLLHTMTENDERPTLPPSAPPPGMYTDKVVDDLLATAKRLERHYVTLLDPAGLLTQQTNQISGLIDANYALIRGQIRGLVQSVDAVVVRVGHVEISQESSADRIQRMELDMAALRHQVDRMDAELQAMKPDQLP